MMYFLHNHAYGLINPQRGHGRAPALVARLCDANVSQRVESIRQACNNENEEHPLHVRKDFSHGTYTYDRGRRPRWRTRLPCWLATLITPDGWRQLPRYPRRLGPGAGGNRIRGRDGTIDCKQT